MVKINLRIMDKIIDTITALLLAIMVSSIFLQVVARYVFNNALPWPEELGRFLFAWIVFLGIVSVLRSDEMLSLNLIYSVLPKQIGNYLKLFISIVVFLFLLIIIKGGWEFMSRQMSQTSVAMSIPMWIVYLVIPLGTSLMALEMFLQIVLQVRALIGGQDKNESEVEK